MTILEYTVRCSFISFCPRFEVALLLCNGRPVSRPLPWGICLNAVLSRISRKLFDWVVCKFFQELLINLTPSSSLSRTRFSAIPASHTPRALVNSFLAVVLTYARRRFGLLESFRALIP